MNNQLELLSWYPNQPGWKAQDTSRRAAKAIRSRAVTLRDRTLDALCKCAMTADEVAAYLDEAVLAIRPRLSELGKQGLITDTGARRLNSSGKSAIVWRAN